MDHFYRSILMIVVALGSARPTHAVANEQGNWKPHHVQQFTAQGDQTRKLPAKFQIVTELWKRSVAVPYIVYMPEKDRLALLVSCDYPQPPHRPFLLFSDDHGATWTEPKLANPNIASLGKGLAYLGDGRLMFTAGTRGHFSDDYGQTWPRSSDKPGFPSGVRAAEWDPPFVDRNRQTGKVTRIISTAYRNNNQAFMRSSTDMGKTWGSNIDVPQWHGYNEIALVRATNGDIVAACRTEMAEKFSGQIDHYEGLGVSISKDNGQSWSDVEMLYEYGRHHPSMVVLPNGAILMTHVVRRGYPNDAEGFQQFGVEAVVSHDHGASWDMARRYILHKWSANRKDRRAWWASSQGTSTLLLPDGHLLTAFGTGYRSPGEAGKAFAPRDVGLIQWRVDSRL